MDFLVFIHRIESFDVPRFLLSHPLDSDDVWTYLFIKPVMCGCARMGILSEPLPFLTRHVRYICVGGIYEPLPYFTGRVLSFVGN